MFGGELDYDIPLAKWDETWLFVLDSEITSVSEQEVEQNNMKIYQDDATGQIASALFLCKLYNPLTADVHLWIHYLPVTCGEQ